MFVAGKKGVLRLYPDLAGHLSESNQLTESSKAEHKAAGLDQLTPEELNTISELNVQYKTKFTFPFVICAKLNKKEAIITGLNNRLGYEPEQEVNNGIDQVKKICNIRLKLQVE